MKRQNYFKFLLLLLLTCCMIVFCSCGADVKDGVGTEAPNENVGDFIDNEPEKTDGVEFTTVNTNAKILRTVKIYSETKNFTNATETVKKELLAAGEDLSCVFRDVEFCSVYRPLSSEELPCITAEE